MKIDHIKKRPDSPGFVPGGPVMAAQLPDPNMIGNMSAWGLDFRQIEAGPMATSIRLRNGSLVSMIEISMNRKVHQQGMAPPGALTFGLPLSGAGFAWAGADASSDHLLTFGAEDGFDGVTRPDFHGLTFSVSDTVIETLSDRLGLPLDDTVRRSGVFHAMSDSLDIDRLARKALRFMCPAQNLALEPADEEELLALFLGIAARTDRLEDRSKGWQRARAVRRAVELMEQKPDENIPISLICEAAGVSLRTLNRAFHDKFGIGPKAYYLSLRLNHLHRALIDRRESQNIVDAANALGFWHMGQLARDYRKQFGELPSQTLN